MVRETWIDYAKLIGIFWVVFAHTLSAADMQVSVIRNVVYSFHMPLFFFLSGYLYKRKGVKISILSLLVPYFCYCLINLVYLLVFHNNWQNLNKMLIGVILGNGYDLGCSIMPAVPCWFFICLLWMRLMFDLVQRINMLLLFAFILPFIAYSFVKNHIDIYFSIDSAMMAFPFFLTGNILKRIDIIKIINLKKWIIFLPFFMFLSLCLNIYNGRVSVNAVYFGTNPIVFYVNAFLGIFSVIYLSGFLVYRSRVVETISIGTPLIVGIHMIFLGPILNMCRLMINSILPQDFFIYRFFASLIVIFLSFFIILLCIKYAPVLLGKLNRKNCYEK